MAIRRHIDYNWHNGTYSGYVDLGHGPEAEEAKEALVFMLVGMSGGWKAPIAYYLTKGLTAETQKELVVHSINKFSQATAPFSVRLITYTHTRARLGWIILFCLPTLIKPALEGSK